MRKIYVKPAVLRELQIEAENAILESSVSDDMTVQTTGQIVESYNMADDSFNHSWEAGE
ncbi:MAG: hypothetical protein J5498_07860 [Bacteroidales bacterium]|jgi:hypothetical protein|nr:hypothetical protein [Bacteroidales bacterium]MEE3406254.1 hypothetical protein [Candidatus Cryptobacteroides sp.]SKC60362.1 hypothetical protein SAMN06298215_1918 [Bacteroidales bacterium WCE2008]MBO7365680.1 hypothetical protein [Bacteroidales bacterium]MBO7622601.1 hypothetical protein [Bacteroidales bacterium]